MRTKYLKIIPFLFILILSAGLSYSIEWQPVKVKCPICGDTNVFQEVTAYGDYIYSFPTRFQYIFWPVTENNGIYCCHKCHYSTFMEDFDSLTIKNHKTDSVRKYLKTLGYSKYLINYRADPSIKLRIAEKIYSIVGMNDYFWCYFYRVQGYYYDAEGKFPQADSARQKALAIISKMITQNKEPGSKKEYLLISAAMKHFLRNDIAALSDLNAAKELTYSSNPPSDRDKDNDLYLTDLINDYINIITPRQMTPPVAPQKK